MRESSTDSVRLELEAPGEVPAGAPVRLALHLRNTGREPAVVHLRGRTITFDIVITRPAGDTVWRRLGQEPIQEIVQLRRLEPGGELVLEARWDQRDRQGRQVPAGEYVVNGVVFGEQPERWTTVPHVLRVLTAQRP